MFQTINLPVGTVEKIINIDDKRVLVPIEQVKEYLDQDKKHVVRSMYGIPNIDNKIVTYQTDISYISKITKEPITNDQNVKYYKVSVKYFPSEKCEDIILPSYVKLFSRSAKSYVPVEYIRKSDVLTDYANNIVQVFETVEVPDFKPTEYYSIKVSSNNDKYPITFYVYGIFANIFYNDFKSEE